MFLWALHKSVSKYLTKILTFISSPVILMMIGDSMALLSTVQNDDDDDARR